MSRAGVAAAVVITVAILALASAWAAVGAPSGASGSPGLTYGANLGDGRSLVIRLRADRKRIANLIFEWEIPASRCTKPGLSSDMRGGMTWTGSELDHPIVVRDGRFTTRTTDEYLYEGYAYVEKTRITGRFVARRVEGTIEASLDAVRQDGPGAFRCALPPSRFTAAD